MNPKMNLSALLIVLLFSLKLVSSGESLKPAGGAPVKMNPKMNLSALLIVLLFSLGLVSTAPLAISTGNTCCPRTQKAKIPLKQIVSYYKTSSSCACRPLSLMVPDVVYCRFVTKRGKHWCVNPADAWVKSHAAAVDRRLASTPAISTRA
ncbi:hypothetical protein COCON_G00110920 [Conger conger]|uniref:Chemokine interleukin-8-like domain-containing protein n=1 Tax=Conger conger TaxID=82655 RepID=A0A9Q1HZG1_CONCO|nr:hypothetical protein COCON_G00110920 [Conger conger]